MALSSAEEGGCEMAFENIVGNESAKKLLRHTLDTGRIGHAYILKVSAERDGFLWQGRLPRQF